MEDALICDVREELLALSTFSISICDTLPKKSNDFFAQRARFFNKIMVRSVASDLDKSTAVTFAATLFPKQKRQNQKQLALSRYPFFGCNSNTEFHRPQVTCEPATAVQAL